ncbi:MAG: helix-turn-helix transcriptional regulator [Clostridia bacterium]|nr:helix-turn-helix transcriptional regulator [Clostridia bacterium]
MDIGTALKQQRQRIGLSQSQLAKETGIKQQTISRWENNTHKPDIEQCVILAKYYGITLEELIDVDLP